MFEISIADDNEKGIELIEKIFLKNNYQVRIAMNRREALETDVRIFVRTSVFSETDVKGKKQKIKIYSIQYKQNSNKKNDAEVTFF